MCLAHQKKQKHIDYRSLNKEADKVVQLFKGLSLQLSEKSNKIFINIMQKENILVTKSFKPSLQMSENIEKVALLTEKACVEARCLLDFSK